MHFTGKSSIRGIVVLLAAFLQRAASGQTHPEVLVVYNTNYADSLTVANHYMSQRNIPASNLCAITPPEDDFIAYSDYMASVSTPIQNCLNTVGSRTILYIVMSYLTPFSVYTGPQGSAAVDSWLADIWNKYVSQPFVIVPSAFQPYYADSQSQGNVYTPFQTFAAYRANARNPLIYSVWRLDGPTETIASALVDQAIAAETSGGPSGQACIDRRFGDLTGQPDASYTTGDYDLYQAASFLQQAGTTVTEDSNPAEFGTAPAPLTCPDTAFYSGWYSYDNYNNAFTWETGSIGWHLDSASALNPRSGPSWVPNALSLGIAVTSGSVNEPYLQGLVRPGGTFRNLLEGASVGEAFLRNTRWLKWEIMYVGDPLYKPFGTGLAPFSPLQPVNSFQLSPQEIVGGANSTGTISLSAPAPTGGTAFTLSAPAGVTLPSAVTVPTGAEKVSFPITTAAVSQSQYGLITATSASVILQNTIITDPLLGTFVPAFNPTMVGLPVGVTAILSGPAPTGGIVIGLSSDNAAITVPATVTVPAGSAVATFTAGSTPVISSVTANITGTYAGASVPFTLSVVPAISSFSALFPTINAGGQTELDLNLGTNVPTGYTATVQLTSSDPAALSVPASVTIAAGAHFANWFAVSSPSSSGNIVTVTASYGGATATATATID
jgi:uncharacterized protein (TIGR03790 family)